MLQTVEFGATCTQCRKEQSQRFKRVALLRLLKGGHPIEAFCTACDVFFSMDPNERAALAAILYDYKYLERSGEASADKLSTAEPKRRA